MSGMGITRARLRMAVLGYRVVTSTSALSSAAPGSSIRGSSARPIATGTGPSSGTSIWGFGCPGRLPLDSLPHYVLGFPKGRSPLWPLCFLLPWRLFAPNDLPRRGLRPAREPGRSPVRARCPRRLLVPLSEEPPLGQSQQERTRQPEQQSGVSGGQHASMPEFRGSRTAGGCG